MKRLCLALLLVGLLYNYSSAVDTLDATKPANSELISTFATYERETRAKVNELIGEIPDISNWDVVTVAHTATSGDKLAVDTSAAVCTITLPATPIEGSYVYIADAKSTWPTYPVTLNRNGIPIQGVAANYTLNVSGIYYVVYVDASYGWLVFGTSLTNYYAGMTSLSSYSTTDFGPIVDALTSGILVIDEDMTLTTSASVADNVRLLFIPGSEITIASGSNLTIPSPSHIIAGPNQKIFVRAGASPLTFTEPGTAYVDWLGPDTTGVTDAYADIYALLGALPVASTLSFGSGIYLTTTGINVTTGINLTGACVAKAEDNTYGSTIKATTGVTGTLLTWEPASPYIGDHLISCITLDGNNIASDGLQIKQGSRLKVEDVVAYDFTARGFWVDGWASGTAALETLTYNYALGITFDRCSAIENSKGFAVERKGTGVWGTTSFRDCYTISNDVALFVKGDNATSADAYYYDKYGTTVAWDGGTLDGKSTAGRDILVRGKDGANITIRNAYTESYGGNPLHYWLSGNSFASVSGGPTSPIYWYSRFDDNSTLCMEASGNNAGHWNELYGGMGYYGFTTERMCIGGKISDKSSYGSPWWPSDRAVQTNTLAYKGMRITDNYGTQWLQVEDNGTGYDGTEGSGSAILNNASRWTPINGRVIIPITYTDFNRGNFIPFWAEADFVMTGLTFVVEDAFTSGDSSAGCNAENGFVEFGNESNPGLFINPTQGKVTNLSARASISAYDNDNATNALGTTYTSTSTSTSTMDDQNGTDGNLTVYTTTLTTTVGVHKTYFMPGYASSVITGLTYGTDYPYSYVRLVACPNTAGVTSLYTDDWTAGKGWLIIEGYNLEYNRYGE